MYELRRVCAREEAARPSLVAGDRMECSTAEFMLRCEVLIRHELEERAPDNALIALLGDAVRFAREAIRPGQQ